jgi:hypothetical protein
MNMADIDAQVQQLYVAYFGRPADYLGLQYWTKAAATTAGYTTMVNAFAQSDEYHAMYNGLDNRVLVDTVYEHQKNVTIGDVVTAVAAGAQGNDSVVFNAKVSVAELFTDHLDQAAERLAYNGSTANQMAADYLAAIKDPATAGIALEPTNIDALISKMTGGLQLPGVTGVEAQLVGVADAAATPIHG